MKIPFMDLRRQHESLKLEIQQAFDTIINNSSFIGGEEKDLFEQEFAK